MRPSRHVGYSIKTAEDEITGMQRLVLFSLLGTVFLSTAVGAPATQVSFLDHVLKVSEFQKDTALRKRVLAECHNNPGQLRNDANCVNAEKAAVSAHLSDKPPRF